jgi:alkylated DNA repair dioxygenase AlkB
MVMDLHIPLARGAWIELKREFLPAAEADALFQMLARELVWEQRSIVLFGKSVLQPRLIAWAGQLPYRYSGQTLPPRPATPTVAKLLSLVSQAAGVPFNHVLANRYRHGQDSMGLHADDEPELGPDPVVATLSLGAERRLMLVPKRRSEDERRKIVLPHGSVLIMGGTCQRHYRHGIPRVSGSPGERISLTFRRILTEPGG